MGISVAPPAGVIPLADQALGRRESSRSSDHRTTLSSRERDPGDSIRRRVASAMVRLGYSPEDWARLEADLREQHLSHEAVPARPSPYGRKYEILAPVTGPNGMTAWIRSIWIVRTEEDRARLVTLVP